MLVLTDRPSPCRQRCSGRPRRRPARRARRGRRRRRRTARPRWRRRSRRRARGGGCPGSGTIHGCWASSHASATCPGVRPSSLGEARGRGRPAPGWRRGCRRRTAGSCAADVAGGELASRPSTVPVRKPLPSGLNGTNPMPSSAQVGQHLGLGVAGPQRVLALHRGDRVHGVRAPDRVGAGLGQPEVADLARAATSSPTVPATSSIGTSGSTRCW